MLHKPLTPGEQQFVKLFRVRDVSEDFIRNTCQPEYLKAKTPEGREFWSNQARKSKQNADRLLFNPETHCAECGEFLSSYGHCWQCHLPPMDPAQYAVTKTTTVARKPHHIPCGECGACYANEPCGLLQPQAIDHAKLKVHAPAIVHARPSDLV